MTEKIKEFFRPTKFKLLFTFLLAVAMIVEFFLLFYINSQILMNTPVGGAYTGTTYSSTILVIGYSTYYIISNIFSLSFFSSIISAAIAYTFFIILCTIYSYLLVCFFSNIYKRFGGDNKKISNIIILVVLLGLFLPFPMTFHVSPPHTHLPAIEKDQQDFRLLLHECNENKICFELIASMLNTLDIPANESVISVYVDNELKPLGEWKISSGTACKGNTKFLSPGESCYGYVNISSCEPGETHTLKIAHAWGAKKEILVECK